MCLGEAGRTPSLDAELMHYDVLFLGRMFLDDQLGHPWFEQSLEIIFQVDLLELVLQRHGSLAANTHVLPE